jgi:hypothetical protein
MVELLGNRFMEDEAEKMAAGCRKTTLTTGGHVHASLAV